MKVDIAGIEATVVSNEEAEKADLVVCCRADVPRVFTDDVDTTCAWCGHAVYHRPHAPARPPKVCMECVLEKMAATTQ